ncbi:MAG: hypothetical protein ACRCT7_03735 [Shewanella sp.]
MAVEFLVDPYNDERYQFDFFVQHDLASVREARQQINENLASGSSQILRIRIAHESVLSRLSDYLGIEGVKITFTPSPRAQVTEAIKVILPDWVTDEVIIHSDCLRTLRETQELDINDVYRSVLWFTDYTVGLSEFMTLYYENFALYSEALKEPTCFNFIYESLKGEIQQDDLIALIDDVRKHAESKIYIDKLAYASQLEKLRQYAKNEGFNIALPPLPIAPEIIRKAYFFIGSKASPKLENALTKLFEQAIISASELKDSSVLERFPIMPVESFFNNFVEILLSKYTSSMEEFVTSNLPLIPQCYHSDINKLLLNHSVDSLPMDTDIDGTLAWANSYFKVLRDSWVGKASIPQGLETCFSDWYLKNKIRVSRSQNDWTGVSASIQQSLKDREVVVVYMVDALSGLHINEVSTLLAEKLPKCHLNSRFCFAPTPTLTEVGKTAVLTGKKPYTLSKDNEKAMLEVYKSLGITEQTLTVHKSWEHRIAARLNENTQIYLYLENRIDECLHDRKQYEDYNAYGRVVDFVISGLAKHAQEALAAAERWSKKIKFIVTADHGVTKSSGLFEFEGQNVKERVVLNANDVYISDKLYRFDTGYPSLGTCLIPKSRHSFLEVAFAHGGLTPEEVLIPWVELTSDDPKKKPFLLTSDDVSCHSIGDKRWNITLNAIKNVSEENITFKVDPPFSVLGNGNWDCANKQLHLSLHSSVNHEGLVEVVFAVAFKGKHLTTVTRVIDFPNSFVKQSATSSAFDDMLGF